MDRSPCLPPRYKGAAAVTKREIHTGNIWEKSWRREKTVEKKKREREKAEEDEGLDHRLQPGPSAAKPAKATKWIYTVYIRTHAHTHTARAAEAAAAAAMNTKYPNISREFTLLSPLSGERVAAIIFVPFKIEHSKKMKGMHLSKYLLWGLTLNYSRVGLIFSKWPRGKKNNLR